MRTILSLLALFHAVNGAVMLIAPEQWYAATPGVAETGPVNVHFIRDIGLGFLAAGAALALAARSHYPTALLLAASVFLGGHALLHLFEIVAHGRTAADAARDFTLVIVPGLLPLLLASFPGLREKRS